MLSRNKSIFLHSASSFVITFFRSVLIAKYGIEEVEQLELIYRQPAGYSVFDLQLMYNEYKKIYENLKKEKVLGGEYNFFKYGDT